MPFAAAVIDEKKVLKLRYQVAVFQFFRLCKEVLADDDSSRNLTDVCQAALKSFHQWLFVESGTFDDDVAKPLTEEISTKMVLILLLLIIKSQQKDNGESFKLFFRFYFS